MDFTFAVNLWNENNLSLDGTCFNCVGNDGYEPDVSKKISISSRNYTGNIIPAKFNSAANRTVDKDLYSKNEPLGVNLDEEIAILRWNRLYLLEEWDKVDRLHPTSNSTLDFTFNRRSNFNNTGIVYRFGYQRGDNIYITNANIDNNLFKYVLDVSGECDPYKDTIVLLIDVDYWAND